MKATIHQPDFFPWFGFFNKISKANTWVVLDHVENNPRDAAFWGRRVKILVNGQPTWLSITLERPKDPGRIGIPICEMQINMSDPKVFEKCLKTIQMAYARAPYFSDYFFLAKEYFLDTSSSLQERNMRFIQTVMSILEIKTKVVFSSSFKVQTKSTQLLVDLLKAIEADCYLCGRGAVGYQHDELFAENGISLEYNSYVPPEYPQMRTERFVPGLSILDALFCMDKASLIEAVHKA